MKTIILTGRYSGENYIYESVEEAKLWLGGTHAPRNINNQPLDTFPMWYDGDTGDWVLSDDNKVVQLLYRHCRQTTTKKGVKRYFKNGQPILTYHYRFCFGSSVRWNKQDGTWSQHAVIAIPKTDTGILPHGYTLDKLTLHLGKLASHKKKLFAFYMSINPDPPEALRQVMIAFGEENRFKNYPAKNITIGSIQLLTDRMVINHLQLYITDMDDFKSKLKNAVSSRNLSIEQSLDTIVDVMKNGKSALARLKAAEMNLTIQKYIHSDDKTYLPESEISTLNNQVEGAVELKNSAQLPLPPDSRMIQTAIYENLSRLEDD